MSTSLQLFSECACDTQYMPTLQDSIVIAHKSSRLTAISHQLILHEP